jgi:hypothetical protein
MERFEEQARIEARMQEFTAPYSYMRPAGIDVNILEPPRGSESARNAESPKATMAAILRLLEEHLYRVRIDKEHLKVTPAAQEPRKRKTPDIEEKAPAEKTKSEKMRRMRNAWIAPPTEEDVWQIMPTLVREEGGCVATPIERIDGILKYSHVKCGRTYHDMARLKRHANAHINGYVQCPFISKCHRDSLFTRWVSPFVSLCYRLNTNGSQDHFHEHLKAKHPELGIAAENKTVQVIYAYILKQGALPTRRVTGGEKTTVPFQLLGTQ